MPFMMKVGVVIILLAIVASLGSGLLFLIRDRSQSRRTLNALKIRITLSLVLFLLIAAGLATGYIQPNRSPLASPPAAHDQSM